MPAAAAKTFENALCLLPYFLLRRQENARIEVTLKRFPIPDLSTRARNVHCPIQTDHVAFDFSEFLERVYALGKYDHGSPICFKPFANIFNVPQRKLFQIRRRK